MTTTTADLIQLYLDEQREVMARFPVEKLDAAADLLFQTYETGGTVFGIPLLFAYLFAAWGGLIVLMILAVERGG